MTNPRAPVAALLAEAVRWLMAGRPAEAIPLLREAARQKPGDAAILHDLGLACLESGLIDDAIAALQASIAIHPRFADSHLRLGIAHEAAGAPDAALAAYDTACRILPSLADAHHRAGDLLDSLGRFTPAIDAYRRAAALEPATVAGCIAAAKALLVESRMAAAEQMLRQALSLEEENAAALELLGNLLADCGRFAEAEALLRRAIRNAPLRAGSYYDIVRCRRIGPDDAGLVVDMRAALALPGLEPAQRSRVHLALGKAADDRSAYQDAMHHFDRAQALRDHLVRFDLRAYEAQVERQIAQFTPSYLARHAVAESGAPNPIMILGLPRSGTTLVEQILSLHPAVAAAGELPFWNECAAQCEALFSRSDSQEAPTRQQTSFLAEAGRNYTTMLRGIAPAAGRVTDKMPLNVQWAGLIHCALPMATIIHCRRSLIDTALSIHQTHFNPRMPFPTGGEALVGYIRATQRLVAHWRRVLPSNRFIEVEYEAIVSNPDLEIRKLIENCGLEWNDSCLRPERNARVVRTPSKWQARQPIYRTAIGRWQQYAAWLGPLHRLLENADEPEPLTVNSSVNTDKMLTAEQQI